MLLASCAATPEVGDIERDLLGGWDYNNNRFNPALEGIEVGPTAPYGVAGPNTLDPYSYVVFHLRSSGAVTCAPRDPATTAVRIVGSTNVGGQAYGPRVIVERGANVRPLAIGERTVVAAAIRSQAMAPSEAIPVELEIRYVDDFVRPGGWIRWPQYAVTMWESGCAPRFLAVSIFGPAFELPTTDGVATSLRTVPDVVVPYSGFYDGTDPSLMAKSVVNLDGALNFVGETASGGEGCLTGVSVPANHPSFLGALVTGAAVVTHHPDDPARRPLIVFRTRKGQAYKAHASVMSGGVAQSLCLRSDMRPPSLSGLGSVVNPKTLWPVTVVSSLDVIHATSLTLAPGETATSAFTWAASGTSDRRKLAFLESSQNPRKVELSALADQAIEAARIKTQIGAVPMWSIINPLFSDRAALVLAAEALPPERASEGVEYATDERMLHPVIGDGTCSSGELSTGSPDCPYSPPPLPSPSPDAGTGSGSGLDAGSGSGSGSDAGSDSGSGSGSGSGSDAGSDSGSGSGSGARTRARVPTPARAPARAPAPAPATEVAVMIRCPRCHHRLRGRRCPEHGPPTHSHAPPLPNEPPADLPGIEHLACIAIGGSAQVFLARDGATDVVVKWARWRDSGARRRFAHEAALLRRAAEVVPALRGAGEIAGWPYLVLERLGGHTLADLIANESEKESHRLAARRLAVIARAIAALHACSIVHGDLKPENIFLDGDAGRLIDLGLAIGDDAAIAPGDRGGTLHYTSPEQLAGDAPTAAADVYALGAIAFELLTGRPPFVGDRTVIEYGHTLCRVPRPSQLAAVVPELDAAIVACLAKQPGARPSIHELVALFDAHADGALAPQTTASVSASQRRNEHGPAALLWVASAQRVEVAQRVVAAAGRIVRERPDGTLAAFLWHDHDDPVQAALSVAAQLDIDTSVAIHRAEVVVRRSGTRVLVHGEAADHPERWRPSAPWRGLVCTAAAAEHLDNERVGAESAPGFRRLQPLDRPDRSQVATVPELVARHGLVGEALHVLEAALGGDGPRLLTIEGGVGSGKSRALDELRRALTARGAALINLGGRHGVAGQPTVAPALELALGDVPGLSPLDRLRRLADVGVIVLVDDAHRVEDEVLDLLETAAAWQQARLGVVVATDPALGVARPRWGERATSHVRFQLRPLDDDNARALMRRQLMPARRIPDVLVARLVSRARGNPGALVGLAREIHRRGLVRRFPGGEDFYLAADELDDIVLEPDRRQRAMRELAALPAGLPMLAQVCAALGNGFDIAELDAALRGLPADAHTIDSAAGVAWLARNGMLRPDGGRWAFVEDVVREAAAAQLAPALRRALHAAALDHVTATVDLSAAERAWRIAHHASGAGDATTAASAFLDLARRARLRCSYVEAERMATQAIDVLERAPIEQARTMLAVALAERGRARRPMALYEAARADLGRALDLIAATGERTLAIEILVDDGAICDFTDRLVDSAHAIEHAASLVDDATPPTTRARVDNWLGVVRARAGHLDEAVGLLERAIATASAVGDDETVIGSTLMLGGVFRRTMRLADARAALDDAIARSERRGDVFHVTVGLFNRINLWRVLGDSPAAEADCARAITVAERHGYGQMEIAGWLNLSEVCLAVGRDDDALEAARRAFASARRRFGDHPPVVATSWLALLEAGHGHLDDARGLLELIAENDAAASPLLYLRRAAVAAATSSSRDLAGVIERSTELEAADRLVFDWFVRRISAPSTPACASGGTR